MLTRAELASFFDQAGRSERIGLEVEVGLVDPLSGESVPYDGPGGARALLLALGTGFGGTPVTDGTNLVGIDLPSGGQFSLETGGALEFSSAPCESVGAAIQTALVALRQAAGIADRLGVALLSGSMLPFTPVDEVPWIPKPRVGVMRRYFRTLGEAGNCADGVMGLVLSTQTSFDYVSPRDLIAKLRLHVAASPVAAALFVNSPIQDGVVSGALSRRMQLWRHMDPSRCGVLGFALDENCDVDSVIDWALALPMIYRRRAGRHVAAPARPFGELMTAGFGDGTWPDLDDWRTHLSQTWPHVRVRNTLELRAVDGLPWPHIGSAAAFWTGLTYDPDARTGATEALAGLTAEQLDQAEADVAVHGPAAKIGRYPIRELGRELLRCARLGLEKRAAAGLESAGVATFLDPLEDVAESGVTLAERGIADWQGRLGRSPGAYVAAHRVPAG